MQDFFEENYEYILSHATVKAIEIARKTGMFSDIEDFRQDLYCFLAKRIRHYRPGKGAPNTFIAVCFESAQKNILRNIYRKKRRFVMDAIPLENAAPITAIVNATPEEFQEFIATLTQPARNICRAILIENQPLPDVSKFYHLPQQEILTIIREAMAPFARMIGISDTGRDSGGDHSQGTPETGFPALPRGK